ncbi:MAG: preprotein translocase subunit SecE [Alphaproteobacteria bacterium]|jgi:preprotein translocase subunit SecE
MLVIMKIFIDSLKKEYLMIVTPSFPEVAYISFLVVIVSLLISLSTISIDFVIGSIINSILFN